MKQTNNNSKGQAARPRVGSNGNQQGHTCAVCNRGGAKWLLWTEGSNQPQMVHRPCGKAAQETAPANTTVKVTPSRALREEWVRQKQVASFWDAALGGAKNLAAAKAEKPPAPLAAQTA